MGYYEANSGFKGAKHMDYISANQHLKKHFLETIIDDLNLKGLTEAADILQQELDLLCAQKDGGDASCLAAAPPSTLKTEDL